jgi:hypothetical protein
MKKLMFLLLLTYTFVQTHAQKVPDYSSVENGTSEQKIARANEAALQAATYLLSVPPDTNNKDVKDAMQYLVLWMTATQDYSFEIGNAEAQLYGHSPALLSILFAAMTEYEMKNPANKDDKQKVRLYAVKRLIKYSQNPSNKVEMPEELKKAAVADKKGELDKYLASLDKQ